MSKALDDIFKNLGGRDPAEIQGDLEKALAILKPIKDTKLPLDLVRTAVQALFATTFCSKEACHEPDTQKGAKKSTVGK